MASDTLSTEDQAFLAKCEEELKHRYTDKDEEYMKVYNADPSKPPIIESWWVSQNSQRRNDRRHNRRNHPYTPHRNQDQRQYNRRDYRSNRGYNEYNSGYEDTGHGFRNQRNR